MGLLESGGFKWKVQENDCARSGEYPTSIEGSFRIKDFDGVLGDRSYRPVAGIDEGIVDSLTASLN